MELISCIYVLSRRNWLMANFNSNFIALIPKMKGAIEISQFHSIAMANFLFKIIPNILVDRLSLILPGIICLQQMAFIKGNHIHDCILMISEGINLLNQKVSSGSLGLKIDIHKAFDTFELEFSFNRA